MRLAAFTKARPADAAEEKLASHDWVARLPSPAASRSSELHTAMALELNVGNWAEYDRALVRRGDVTLWLTPDAIATWAAAGVGRRSGQLQYSDLAIETALTLSLLFH